MAVIDDKALRALIRATPELIALFESLARDGTKRRRTTVDELDQLISLDRQRLIAVLRELGEVGLGEFKVGRKGHPSRLEWSEDPRQLAAIALELAASPSQPTGEIAGPPPSDAAVPGDTTQLEPGEVLEHSYVLRRDLRVRLRLPVDLTLREAECLGDWLRGLSFET